LKCSRHPQVETNLSCSKCGTPICPKCLVQTPVGARCPDCANLGRLPTYRVGAVNYFTTAGVGLGMAIACGVAWAVIDWVIPFFSFSLLLAPAAGYAISEVIGRSVNRKRGTGLAIIAGVSVVISLLVRMGFFYFLFGFHLSIISIAIDLVATALGVLVAVNRLR
jgi:hypothetical protein